jgi:predicted transcriptional regulator
MARKTTVYLPDELKQAIERSARQRGIAEAEVIRQALAGSLTARRPRSGFLDAEPFAAQADELLAGFGER